MGLGPDPGLAAMENRARLCESLGVTSSVLIGERYTRGLQSILQTVTERYDDILSAAVRRADGHLIAEAGNHSENWKGMQDIHSTDTHVHVPIHYGGQRWGEMEMRFAPLRGPGWVAWIANPWTTLVSFTAVSGFVMSLVYFSRMFPRGGSASAPHAARTIVDAVPQGIFYTDRYGRLLLVNTTFASLLGTNPTQLNGYQASKLPWLILSTMREEDYPWARAIRAKSPQPAVVMKLVDAQSRRRSLLVHASPLMQDDGECHSAVTSLTDITQLPQDGSSVGSSSHSAAVPSR
jgi:PAS domain S-box-containing protein